MSTPTADIDAVDNILNLMPVLGVDERSLVDGPLLLCEIEHAIDTLKCVRRPGLMELEKNFIKPAKIGWLRYSLVFFKTFLRHTACPLLF